MSTVNLEPGTALPPWELPLTPTLIVSTAIATRDFQDVHHDRDRAQGAGSKDVFMNILTSTALCQRYVEDSLGHDVEILGIAIRLGAPAYPYDTLSFSGEIAEVAEDEVVVKVTGSVSLGAHVIGTVRLARGGRR